MASDGTPVSSTIDDVDAVLFLYYPVKLPYRVRTNTTNGHRMVNDANVLNNYNNGLLTSGCTSLVGCSGDLRHSASPLFKRAPVFVPLDHVLPAAS